MGVRRDQLKNCDVNRLEGNDTKMGRWMCNLKAEDRITVVELRKRLQLSTMKECLRNRRQKCFEVIHKNLSKPMHS